MCKRNFVLSAKQIVSYYTKYMSVKDILKPRLVVKMGGSTFIRKIALILRNADSVNYSQHFYHSRRFHRRIFRQHHWLESFNFYLGYFKLDDFLSYYRLMWWNHSLLVPLFTFSLHRLTLFIFTLWIISLKVKVMLGLGPDHVPRNMRAGRIRTSFS